MSSLVNRQGESAVFSEQIQGHLSSLVDRQVKQVVLSEYTRILERRSCVYSVMVRGVMRLYPLKTEATVLCPCP